MHQRLAEFAGLMARSRRFRSRVARDAAGKGELAEQSAQTIAVAADVRINLAVGTFEIGVGDHSRPAVAGSAHINNVQIRCTDGAVEMGVDEVEPRSGSPMSKQPRLYVFWLQWFMQKGLV